MYFLATVSQLLSEHNSLTNVARAQDSLAVKAARDGLTVHEYVQWWSGHGNPQRALAETLLRLTAHANA